MSPPLWALAIAGWAVATSGCSQQTDGLTKFPVTGIVLVNGRQVPLVVVNFQHTDPDLPGRNARFPVGVTDEDGFFELSTNGKNDGAVPGEYIVTFQWLSSNDSDAFDRFNGQFSNPAQSPFRCTIDEEPTDVPPFEITIPESEILPAERARPSAD